MPSEKQYFALNGAPLSDATVDEVSGADAAGTSGSSQSPVKSKELIHEDSHLLEKVLATVNIAAPLTVSYCLRCGESLIQLFFAGILAKRSGNTRILAGVSLAAMFYNVSFLSMVVGMSTALDTLGSQYNGAQKHFEVVVVMQRSIIVFVLMLVPMSVVWSYVGDIFVAVGVDLETITIMVRYFSIIGWIVPGKIFIVTYRKYLMCMGLTWPHMYMNLVSDVVIILMCVLALHLGWGLTGVAWAWVAGSYAGGLFILAITYYLPAVQRSVAALPFLPLHPDCWSWAGIKEYVCLGFPGMVMVCAEWWAYEILMVFASALGPDAITAQSLIFQLSNLTFMIPSCMGAATNILVGNALGASKQKLAIDMGRTSLGTIVLIEGVVIMPAMLLGGGAFVRMYSTDAAVMWETMRAIPILAAASFCDGVQAVASGILRGTGNQQIGAYANLVCFYLIGVPLSYAFCFALNMRVSGLILGLSVAVAVQCGVLLYFVFLRQDQIYTKLECVDSASYETVSQETEGLGSEWDGVELVGSNSDGDCEILIIKPA
jgi:multidrug resistance protein, MATE family